VKFVSKNSNHLKPFTGNYSHLQPPSPRGIFSPEALQKPACPPKPVGEGGSRSVTPNHGISRLVTGIPKDKKIVYFFMGTPNQTKSTHRP
jgi:hypothetical protein